MSLFKVDPDPQFEYARGSTPYIKFLDRSPRSAVLRIRSVLDEWFDRFPPSEKARLRTQFRSMNNRTHVSAFSELYCHELLLSLGFDVTMHNREESGRAKDFRCVGGTIEMDFEATISTEPKTEQSQSSNATRVTDYLNEHGFVPGFRYALEDLSEGMDSPPLKKLAERVRKWTESFDRRTLREQLECDGAESMPVETFAASDGEIELRLLPRPGEESTVPSHPRSIGVGPITAEYLSDDRSLRNTLKNNARHYRERDLPFAIGVNVWLDHGSVDEIDVLQALIGTEAVKYKFSGLKEIETVLSREPDGLWTGPQGLRNRHVGAVMIAPNLLPWTAHTTRPTAYVNPLASPRFDKSILDIDTVTWDPHSGKIQRSVGKSPREILGLALDWLD